MLMRAQRRLRARSVLGLDLEYFGILVLVRSLARNPATVALRPQSASELRDALAELPEDDRRIGVAARYHEDRGLQEIAEKLRVTESLVRSRLHRARSRLRAISGTWWGRRNLRHRRRCTCTGRCARDLGAAAALGLRSHTCSKFLEELFSIPDETLIDLRGDIVAALNHALLCTGRAPLPLPVRSTSSVTVRASCSRRVGLPEGDPEVDRVLELYLDRLSTAPYRSHQVDAPTRVPYSTRWAVFRSRFAPTSHALQRSWCWPG